MEIRKPAYFDVFRCLASRCPDSCCKEWDVKVDETAAARYRAMPGSLGDRLRQVMYEENGICYFAIEPDGRCPMWRDDGLCRIQAEQGEQALCETCRDFPRLTHDYGAFVEQGLELSCPEAARLILNAPGARWVAESLPDGDAEYDREAMMILLQGRREALDILSDGRFTPAEALPLLLIHGYRVQQRLDGGEEEAFDPESALEMARELACDGDAEVLTDFFMELEVLTPQWKKILSSGWKRQELPQQCRAMARYFVERYYLQAVSDYDLVSRVKLTVISCLLVSGLEGEFWQIAQLYSKEIENNAENVDAILDGAYMSPALTDARLLGLLLE